MKKFVKMSLAAAVAVAGLTTTSSAKDLSEAIKGVDFSGSLTYRYNDRSTDYDAAGVENTQDQKNEQYKLILKTKAPINDTVTANVTVLTKVTDTDSNSGNSLNLTNASFTAKIGGGSVSIGKMGLATPWTTAGHYIDGTQTGNGITAAYPVGAVTLAAAYFANSDIGGFEDNALAVVAALGKVGAVDGQLWYLNVADAADFDGAAAHGYGAKALTAVLGANVGPARVELRHSDLKGNWDTAETQKVDSIKASVKVASVKIGATYAKTGKDGDYVGFDNVDVNNANSICTGWSAVVGNGGHYDADTYGINATVAFNSAVSLKVNYANLEYKEAADDTETVTIDDVYAQISYAMSSNFSGYVRLGSVATDKVGTDEDKTQTRGRLQIKYTF